jgi:hypothetical protein
LQLPNRLSALLATQITNASASLQNQAFSLPAPFPLLSHIYDINANTDFINDFINNVDRRVIPSPNNTYDLLKQLHHDWT